MERYLQSVDSDTCNATFRVLPPYSCGGSTQTHRTTLSSSSHCIARRLIIHSIKPIQEKEKLLQAMVTMAGSTGTSTALALLGHEGWDSGPRPLPLPLPLPPRRSRLRVAAVALRTRPTSLAAPAPPPTPVAPEPVLPSPPVAADVAAVLLEAGVPPADLRRAAGMCPELLSAPAEAVEAALRFLTEEAGVPAADLPRVLRRRPRLLVSPVAARLRPTLYFLRALGVPDLHRRADLLSFSVEDKLLPRIEFLQSLGLPARAARSMARRFPALFCYGVEGNMRPKAEYLMRDMGRAADELFDFPEYFSYALATRIAPRHEVCAAGGVRLPLPAMLRPGEAKFRATLESCVGSMLPRRRSPLWHATWVHDDDDDGGRVATPSVM